MSVVMRLGLRVLVCILMLGLWPAVAWGQLDKPLNAPAFPGLGQPGSVGHLPSVGGASEGIALEGAPGRKSFAPHAALLYNSAGGLGESGVGWQMEFGRIERSSREGSPALSLSDKFVFHLAGASAEIIPIGAGEYRARLEGIYRRYTRVGDHWEVRDASGNVYLFGNSGATRIDGQLWMLDRITDPNGNTISISYRVDGGSFYPNVVHYTGYAPTGDLGPNEIRFDYDPRDDQRISYLFGVEQRRSLRLSRASFFAEGQLVRRYKITYDVSPSNQRSLVKAIDLVTSDESSVRSRSYSYRIQNLGFGVPDGDHHLPYTFYDSNGRDRGGRTADVNGDTFLDVLDNGQNVYLGDGHGLFTRDAAWSASLVAAGVAFVGSQGLDAGTRLIDVNGDQRPDLIVATGSARRVLLNTGTDWSPSASYTTSLGSIQESVSAPRDQLGLPCFDGGVDGGPSDGVAEADPPCGELTAYNLGFSFVQSSGDSSGVVPADVNGDGLLDFVWSYETTDALFVFEPPDGSLIPQPPRRATAKVSAVYLNTGDGWQKSPPLSTALGTINPFVINTQLGGYDVLDVNGDGLADIVNTSAPTAAGDNRAVLLGTGTGWVSQSDYTNSLRMTAIVSLDQSKSQGLVPLDFNGDGLIDYLRGDESTKIAYRNTGLGWVEEPAMSANLVDIGFVSVNGDGVPNGFLFGDVDGDGISDVLQSKDGAANPIRYARGPAGDLLTHVETGLGETFDLAYQPSSRFDNRGADTVQQLPFVLNVLTSITRSAGRGSPVGGTFSYAGGLYADRDLRGFARSESTDFHGNRTATRYDQSESLAGQVTSAEVSDASALRRRTTVAYQLATPAAGVTQIRPSQTDVETFDPGGTVHTRTRTTYDDFLNVIELSKDGDVDVADDGARTVFTFANGAGVGIVNAVTRTRVFDTSGALRSESAVFYDSLAEGQIAKGNPTKFVDSSLSSAPPIVRQAAYDAFGNPVRLTDAAGSVSTIEYAYHATFKSRAVDPLGRVRATETDPRFGVATRETDPNGQIISRTYDAAARLVRETLPGDEASPFGTRTVTYSPLGANQFFRIAATEVPGAPGTMDTVGFVDGFGRVYRLESEAAGGRTVVVTLEYDDRGEVTQSSLPFFAGDAPPLIVTERDVLSRVVRRTQPDGTVDETHYAGKQREFIDRRGNRTLLFDDAQGNTLETQQFVAGSTLVTKQRFDVFGRLIEVIDAVGQSTHVTYDAFGRRTKLEDPNTGTNRYAYDVSGNLVQQIDAAGRTTEFKYNLDGDLIFKKLPTGESISLKYGVARDNAVGRISHVDDAAGKLDIRYDRRGQQVERVRTVEGRTFRTRYAYDSLGRTTSIEYPDGFKAKYRYDTGGLVDRITDRRDEGIVESIDHNALGRPTTMSFANGVNSGFTYDPIGFTRTIATADRRGHSLQNIAYDYDPEGNVTRITNFDKTSFSQTFQYDEIHRLVHAVGGYGDETYRYDAGSTLIRKDNLVFQRDPSHRQQVTCGIDLDLIKKDHNGIGNDPRLRACATELASPAGGLAADDRAAVAKILSKSKKNDREIGESLLISYDKLGNISSRTGEVADFEHGHHDDDAARSYVYDAENRLLRIESKDDHGHREIIEENVYDASGQRILRRTNIRGNGKVADTTVFIDGIFEIDRTHRSRHVRLGTLVVATSTTPFGLSHFRQTEWEDDFSESLTRAACEVSAFGSRHVSWKHAAILGFFAGVMIVRSARVRRSAREVRRGLRASAIAFWTRPFTFVMALLMVGVQLANMGWSQSAAATDSHGDPGEKRFYYHSDHLGNTNVITDERGVEAVRREYAPFGEQFVRDGKRDLEISFNGHLLDKDAGLYYFGARHYDPVLGRFISPDSVVPDQSPQALHRYALNLNNPIRFVDPTGHDFWDVLAGVVVAIVLVAATIVTLGLTGVLAGAILTAVAIGAAVGAVGVGIAALVLAANGTITSFWEGFSLTLVGGLVGAATGGTVQLIAQAAATALPSGSTIWTVFSSNAGIFALGGSAIGGGAGAGVAIAHGSYDLVLLGWFFGAAIGAFVGLASGISLSQGILALHGASGFGQILAIGKLVYGAVSAAGLVLVTGYEGTRRALKALYKNRDFDKYKLPQRVLEIALPALAVGVLVPLIPPPAGGGGDRPGLDTHPGAN